jgi:hypothetical protein
VQYSKFDYEKLISKQKKPEVVNLEAVRAAPQMEVLTNSEEWNKYLSYVQPILESAKEQKTSITQQLLNPTLFDAEKMAQLKSEIIRMTERIEVIETLMTFPKQIIEYGKVESSTEE